MWDSCLSYTFLWALSFYDRNRCCLIANVLNNTLCWNENGTAQHNDSEIQSRFWEVCYFYAIHACPINSIDLNNHHGAADIHYIIVWNPVSLRTTCTQTDSDTSHLWEFFCIDNPPRTCFWKVREIGKDTWRTCKTAHWQQPEAQIEPRTHEGVKPRGLLFLDSINHC